jgi:hypothetical protein
MFNLAIDSKLRGCDVIRLQVEDVSVGGRVRERATIVQKKTGRPVQFELIRFPADCLGGVGLNEAATAAGTSG